MLYKFKSQAAGDVIMMAPQARKVLAAAGREDASERGVIQAAALPAAIAALEKAMQASQQRMAQDGAPDQEEKDTDDNVPLHVRAQPFLEMLKQSQAEGKDVMWGV